MFDTAQPQAGTANQPGKINARDTEPYTSGGIRRARNESPEAFSGGKPFITVRHNKRLLPLSREEAETLAQKGMNYDKLEERYEQLSGKLYEAKGQDKQALIQSQYEAFRNANPELLPEELPECVIDKWKSGVPLSEAYLRHRAQELAAKVSELESEAKRQANRSNEEASMGRIKEGAASITPLSDDRIKIMSAEELNKNHERIWSFLTGDREK